MKHRAFTRVQLLILVSAVAALSAVCLPFVFQVRDQYQRADCRARLNQIGLGFSQYAQDYDKKFPLTTRPEGWVGAINLYLKSEAMFRCPAERERGKDNLTDRWFNRRLAGASTDDVANPANTLLAGDGEPSDDPNISLARMPPRWLENSNSPVKRHLGGGNVVFADGHSKWFKAEQFANDSGAKAPAFLVRQRETQHETQSL